jgi:ACS family hexuronate transporter-like MFS transporter
VASDERVIGRYRWWIGALLFLSTVVNYLDRQTLSVLAPHLKSEFHWSNQDFAWIVIAFRLSYTVMQAVSGRLLDRFGTRNGLSLAVLWYSIIAVLTSCANGFASFCGLRFLLGAGEAANWPAATKAVSEWFPRRERGWAVALFDSGSSVGAALATIIVPFLYLRFGSWRPAFLITGALGFLWLLLWRRHYHPPDTHPRLGEAERRAILADRAEERAGAPPQTDETVPAGTLLGLPQTWGAIASRGLTDPVWFMITDWFAIYLVSKGFDLEKTAVGFWVPFLAADLGNFFGGGVSSWLIRRGWPVLRARKAVVVFGGIGMATLAGTLFASNLFALAGLFAISTFAYAAFSTMALVLPSDLYASASVATVSGMSGTGAGLGTIASTYLIGVVADRYSFGPVLVAASLILLVRGAPAPAPAA